MMIIQLQNADNALLTAAVLSDVSRVAVALAIVAIAVVIALRNARTSLGCKVIFFYLKRYFKQTLPSSFLL